ncbi:O-sialoglycoprotein endopeptidase [Brevibacillus invocatus]|uniref:N(6)-L-threonylcarbamoyladenine synthase n=1 Tax=Brevibacillus invocatus TaxID=173959 RepID=A0A3M8CIS1_9BACL|nr:O-sialoglycoprotein endopeptidase [Brevibacillus invocatus]MCM3078024.1 O-sialoglycoprotein endopeptidase [Brevibacillus invocatus]MCM3427902.1 O-sialoglycoprotein endopeptidase [Brevibacillus invocatus]RNB75471.1 O-sialoglycoprotein endopeptidase [Brevibacillus invocatus]
MTKVLLGIDTSNYRTSLCLAREDGQIVAEAKRLLKVKEGKRGLQQSEAVFQHVMNLPELSEQMKWDAYEIVAVCVSEKPRPVDQSYMPVFKVGEGLAKSLSIYLQVPLYLTTHQEGHIAAGEYTAEERPANNRFLAVHLSGGTSEILLCDRHESGYAIEKVGGTIDLHAGQLVDRIGVAMGMSFPAGPQLEQLAKNAAGDFRISSAVDGLNFSFSGPEASLLRAIEAGQVNQEDIARATEQCIANTLEKALRHALEKGMPRDILIVGGVAANQYMRERLINRLEHPAVKAKLYFCDPVYSGDNAYGVAMLGWMKQKANII